MKSNLKAAVPWLLLVFFLLLPIYAISVAFAIRSGLFDLGDNTIDAEEYKALWALVASGLGTAATLIGLLFTRSHNQRTIAFQEDIENRKLVAQREADERLTLETAVRGLELLTTGDGNYAPKARIAGALATLVHLGHPVIAMRSLSAAWEDNAVDSATACWLISEVLLTGTPEGMLEASGLLRSHVDKLPAPKKGVIEWPDAVWHQWPLRISGKARLNILYASIDLLLVRPRSWWDESYGWIIGLLSEVMMADTEPVMRNTASIMLRPLVMELSKEPDHEDYVIWDNDDNRRSFDEAIELVRDYRVDGPYFGDAHIYGSRIKAWIEGKSSSDNSLSADP